VAHEVPHLAAIDLLLGASTIAEGPVHMVGARFCKVVHAHEQLNVRPHVSESIALFGVGVSHGDLW